MERASAESRRLIPTGQRPGKSIGARRDRGRGMLS